jgi:hypothetical protein
MGWGPVDQQVSNRHDKRAPFDYAQGRSLIMGHPVGAAYWSMWTVPGMRRA